MVKRKQNTSKKEIFEVKEGPAHFDHQLSLNLNCRCSSSKVWKCDC